MITLTFVDARIWPPDPSVGDQDWLVVHPSGDIVLAYCSTEEEAERVRYDLARASDRLVKRAS